MTTATNRGWLRLRPYLVAACLTVAAVLLRAALKSWVGDGPVLVIFLIPIIVTAYVGGLWPGLFATALACLATAVLVFPPIGQLWFSRPIDFAQWLLMLLEGVLVSVLFAELERWRRRAMKADADPADTRAVGTERKIRIGFAIALAFIGIIGIVSYLSVARLNENLRRVSHSQQVMADIDLLVATTTEAEGAQRGFLLTGEELFAADYTRAAGRVDGIEQQLRDGVRDDPGQLARAEELATAVRQRLARSDEIMQLRRNGGLPAVLADISRRRPGIALQQRVRALAKGMKEVELSRLATRERGATASSNLAQSVIFGGSALALVFVGLALYFIRKDFAGRARAESELSRFFDLSIDLFVISSGDGYFKRVSPAITDILGYTIEEALRIPYLDLIHPEDQPAALRAIEAQMERGERIEQFVGRYCHKNGSWRTLSWRSIPRGDLMFATARDVTDSVRAELDLREAKEQLEARVIERTRALEDVNQALRSSERRFRALIEHGSDSIALIDGDNRIIYLSPAVQSVEGYRPEELVGTNGRDLTHPDDLPIIARAVEQLLANPGKPIPVIWRRKHKLGHYIWLEGVATNLLDDPSVGAIVTNYRDITERLAHETRLGEQLQRLALLSRITHAIGERQDLRSIFQVVVARLEEELPVDFCCVFLYSVGDNRLTVTCVGTRSDPLASQIGLTQNAVVPIDENGLARCVRGHLVYEPDIAATPFPFPQRLASSGLGAMVIAPLLVESQVFGVMVCARRATQSFSSGECEFLRQVSEHVALAAHQAQLYGALQQAYDDLRQTQQQVMQQERLRALGQMASGIAHDINNAISPVALYTEALLEREPLSDRARKQLEIIQRAVDDVAQTVARMGEFYRTREPQAALAPVDLNLLVEHVVDLTRARWSDMAQQRGAAIEMRLDLSEPLPKIAAVESQIRDALVNLVFNAVDAMPNGGPLTMRTRVTADENNNGRGQIVHIEVIDAGIGMDEDTRKRCLEPFFTTKGMRGTGLGLAMVYGVAQRHGATIEIESEPGRGTTVGLSFTVAPLAAAASTPNVSARLDPLRILIVDDDPLLLKSLRDALESDGHQVTSASGGQAGINAFVESHASGVPFQAVITDLGMPHVDGRKVAQTVKTSLPETYVLMLTGWGRRLVAEGDVPPGVNQVVSKPPKIVEIRAALAAHFARQ